MKPLHSYGLYIFVMGASFAVVIALVQAVCMIYDVPPMFTPNLTFNARMSFLQKRDPLPPVAVVSGSSIAVYDIDTDFLEARENRHYIDLGVDGISIEGAQHLLQQFGHLTPVREVILAMQPYELRDNPLQNFAVPDWVFNKYVTGRMNWFEELAYRDLPGLYQYFWLRPQLTARDDNVSVAYSPTGSVPLTPHKLGNLRWQDANTIVLDPRCSHCFEAAESFCSAVTQTGVPFTFFLAPITHQVLALRPDLLAADTARRIRLKAIAQSCGAKVFDAAAEADISDECFEDAVHLNAMGMQQITALFVRERRGETSSKPVRITCSGEGKTAALDGL